MVIYLGSHLLMRPLATVPFVLLLFLLGPTVATSQIKWPDEPKPQSKLSRSVWEKVESNDVEGALKLLDKAIVDKEELFESYRLRATIRSRFANNVDGALEDLRHALAIKPGDPEIHRLRANLYIKHKNDTSAAIQEYNEVLKATPGSVMFLTARAESYSKLKQYGPALDDINKVIQIEPENISAHLTKADILTAQTSLAAGTGYLSKFLKTYTEQHTGNLPKIRGEKVLKKGLKTLGKGVAEVPVTRHSRSQMVVSSNADWEKQTRDQSTARLLSRAYLSLGRSYIQLNLLDGALAALTSALDFDPNAEEAMGLRGVIYLTRNEPRKAIKEFDEALDIGDEGYFYLNRGLAYLLVNDDKKAQKDFDFLLKKWPESRATMEARIEEAKKQRSATTK